MNSKEVKVLGIRLYWKLDFNFFRHRQFSPVHPPTLSISRTKSATLIKLLIN